MPSLEQVKEWSDKLELNPAEVSHWFRCKWRIKLMSPLLQAAAVSAPPQPIPSVVNGCGVTDSVNENASYSRTDSGSDGGQGDDGQGNNNNDDDDDDDGFINIECETIVEEVAQDPPLQEMEVT